MDFLTSLPPCGAALVVFLLRIVDVSLGTLRTIAMVQGRVTLSVLLGFFETLIWLTAVAQVLLSVKDSPLLMLAYCAGFATGCAVGIQIDKAIALGVIVVRMFSSESGVAVAVALRGKGWKPTTFQGHGGDGPNTLIYCICPRREASSLVRTAQSVDPHIYYSVDLVREYYGGAGDPLASSPGLRSVFRK